MTKEQEACQALSKYFRRIVQMIRWHIITSKVNVYFEGSYYD